MKSTTYSALTPHFPFYKHSIKSRTNQNSRTSLPIYFLNQLLDSYVKLCYTKSKSGSVQGATQLNAPRMRGIRYQPTDTASCGSIRRLLWDA